MSHDNNIMMSLHPILPQCTYIVTCTGTYSCEHHLWQSFLCQNNDVCVEAEYHCDCQIRYGGNYCKNILLDHCARDKG